jgi:hypothetical protein
MTWGRLALGNGEKETAFEADWSHPGQHNAQCWFSIEIDSLVDEIHYD